MTSNRKQNKPARQEKLQEVLVRKRLRLAKHRAGYRHPNPPEERMQDAFNSWGAQNKNISASGLIDTSRFSKFYIFLTEQLESDPKYVYKVDDEYRTTMTATRR